MTDYLPYLGDVLAGVASANDALSRQGWNALMADGAQLAWNQAHPVLSTSLPEQLGHGDLVGKGWTLYEIHLTLADTVQLARAPGASTATGGIAMQLRLGPNLLVAKSTTPSVFGRDFDPKFSVDFGIAVDFAVSVVPDRMLMHVTVGSAHITGNDFTSDPHLDSQNLTADLADALGSVVIPFFGGRDLVQMVEGVIHKHEFAPLLNQALQPVNDLLGQLAAEGMGAVVALFPDAAVPAGLSTQSVTLGGGSAGASTPMLVLATPVTGDGTVRGQVHWPKDQGEPAMSQPYAGAFALSASVDHGAARGQFAQATDVTHLTTWEYAGTDTEHILNYALTGLPIDQAITIECTADSAVPWSGPAAAMIRSVERDGWKGVVTVRQGVDLNEKFHVQGQAHRGIGDQVELNPQPIPPGRTDVSHAEGRFHGISDQVELNPQPIPPGRDQSIEQALAGKRRVARVTSGIGESEAAITGHVGKLDPHTSEMTIDTATRANPSGAGSVASINFVVRLIPMPG
ncbi:MAG: hypothetical protein ABIQ61_13790 [Ornithinibacter sp.]